MKNLCVIGDSFCAHRDDDYDWPKQLANLLHLNLIGHGCSGESWWSVRKKFMEIYQSKEFDSTEIFIFCHTDCHRPIGISSEVTSTEVPESVKKIYLNYFFNVDFDHWACLQWFKELNELLKDKKVIHIQNFHSTNEFFNTLNGTKFIRPVLLDLSLKKSSIDSFLKDHRHNHFSKDENIKLANFLFKTCLESNWQNQELEITL